MHELERERLLTRVFAARDRLEVLVEQTSNPELVHLIREADAVAAALEAECHLAPAVTPSLHERIAQQAEVVDQLAVYVGQPSETG